MPYVFVAPFFLLFAGFTLYPVLYALVLSVTYWHGVGTPRFIGWGNYTFLLTDDEFWGSIGNAATLWLLVVPAQTLLAVTGAVVLSAPALRLRWLWRTAFLVPFVTPLVAMAQVWKDLFSSVDSESGLDGPVNTLLHTLHLPTVGWLTTEEWAKPTLALFLIWKTSGFALVLMMAAVQHIPRELYEAAALDGAGPLTQFRRVTVPLLRRPIAFWVVVATLTIFQMFAEPYVLTGGGPYGATTTPGLFLRAYITNSDLGTGAANSILLIVLVFVLSLLALRLLRPGMDLGTSSANALTLAAPRPVAGFSRDRRRPLRLLGYLPLVLLAASFLYPLVWMIASSVMARTDAGALPLSLDPWTVTVQRFIDAVHEGPPFLLDGFKNTFIVLACKEALTLFFCPLAGFAFAKYRFPGRNALFGVVLATLMLPVLVLIVPLFLEMNALGWVNTYPALIVPGAIDAFGIFWMRQVIADVPDELLEAGRIDGCAPFRLYWRVVLPIIQPGLAALAIFTSLTVYNDFVWPVIVTVTDEMQTLPLVLDNVPSSAAETLATLPILALFLVFQRPLMHGILAGSLKG